MLQGKFVRSDGLVITNNITSFGTSLILAMAFRGESIPLWMGLCDAVPDSQLLIENCNEPVLGVGGYSRQSLPVGMDSWPHLSAFNGESFLRSKEVEFLPDAAPFSGPVRRLMLVTSQINPTGEVFSISAALPESVTFGPATPPLQRKFHYEIYLR